MVALMVLALGLAGIAALLVNGMGATGTATVRSEAVTFAHTGAEMMRANLIAYTGGWYDGTNTSGVAPSAVNCTGNCSETDQASNDYLSWRLRMSQSLPDGQGFICMDASPNDGQPDALACDPTGGARNVIKVFWRDSRDIESLDTGADYHRFATSVIP